LQPYIRPVSMASTVAAEPVPSAHVYFAVSRFNLGRKGNESLTAVIAYLRSHAGAKASTKGFHDSQGGANSATNLNLSNNRAAAVRDALQRAGITADRLTIDRPAESHGSGTNAEARRVGSPCNHEEPQRSHRYTGELPF
jgi:outer membrane protein OmpA-like peptidoglycan-associated protein